MATASQAGRGQAGQHRGHAHTDSEKLEDQAATAALYVTNQERAERAARSGNVYPLDGDQKLSAASAATSLKHANPQDLPSFPVVGISNKEASAGAAANLANKNQKPFEHWKPDPSASASAAAVLAKDYKAPPLWHAEQSAYGSKAAVLAAREGASVDVWRPGKSAWGQSAANQAARQGDGLSPQVDYGYTPDGRNKSLVAATGAMSASRKRARSTPSNIESYPDAANSAANALNAASIASRPHSGRTAEQQSTSPGLDAARIHNIAKSNVSREMYTSHPPVALEVEEKKKQDTLRAAALSMAKQMYTVQRKTINDAAQSRRSDSHSAANIVHGRRFSDASASESVAAPMRFNSLEEAAKKLAAERLAKLHDEHAAYRNYYGATPPTSRVSLRGKPRRRASSEGRGVNEDEEQSRRIRSEMSIFSNKLAEVDTKKRKKDRDALMAAAQRNVKASIHGMDERVFAETGKVPPSMMEEWEAKARAKSEADSKSRMANHGKIDIGGGKFLDQADVDAVAMRNVQPVLDDINDKAEKQRARQEEVRLEQEEATRLAQQEKAREKEVRAEQKRAKELEKQQERTRKAEEKAKKAEDKRHSKEASAATTSEQREGVAQETTLTKEAEKLLAVRPTKTSVIKDEAPQDDTVAERETGVAEPESGVHVESAADIDEGPVQAEEDPADFTVTSTWIEAVKEGPPSHLIEPPATLPTTTETTTTPKIETTKPAASTEAGAASPKSDSRVKSWLREKFSRRSSKSMPAESKSPEEGKTFVGGAALTGGNASNSSIDRRDSSFREVAMAGRPEVAETTAEEHPVATDHLATGEDDDGRRSRSRKRTPSPTQAPEGEEEEEYQDAHATAETGEDLDEQRDQFDQDKLAPPPTSSSSARKSGSPARDSKFSEEF